jgi:ABC-type uncharacterized transport system, permease component
MQIKNYYFRKYLPFTQAGIQSLLSYRLDFFLYRIGDVLTAFVTYFVWRAVFLSSSHPQLNGFTINQMVIYIFLSFLTTELSSSDGTWTIGEEVKDGSIAMRLLKPINFNATYLFEEIGHKIVSAGMIIPPLLGGMIVYQFFNPNVVPFNLENLVLFLFSALLAYLINFYFNVCYGFSAFVFKNLWGSNHMKNAIVAFMSGTLIPLAFYPQLLGKILQFFPFASLVYTPVMIYMGKYDINQLYLVIFLQLFWLIFFIFLSKFIWHFTIKHLIIQGG